MRRGPSRRPASVLVLALVVMAVLLILITMALNATSTGARMQSDRQVRDKAFYLAEAGRQRALSTLAFQGFWGHDGEVFDLDGGTYTVTAADVATGAATSRWTLTSLGTVEGAAGPVTVTVVQEVDVEYAGGTDPGGGKGKGKGGGGGSTTPSGAVVGVTPVPGSWGRR